jgi:Uma2 family endonuclease
MSSATPVRASLADLYAEKGKAELIGGRIVPLMPTGRRPNRIAGRIFRSLDDHAATTGRGEAYTDNMGFAVAELRSGRESFSPDASFYTGPFPTDEMRFITGPPTLAVEVRRETDYGVAAEAEMAAKRADYFEAGTMVVWDVDPTAERVEVYRSDAPEEPMRFHRGQVANAEPAVPGWVMSLDRIFA